MNNFNFTEEEMVRIIPGTPEQFVLQIKRLDRNRNLFQAMSKNGQKKAYELFKFENMIKPVYACLEKVAKSAVSENA